LQTRESCTSFNTSAQNPGSSLAKRAQFPILRFMPPARTLLACLVFLGALPLRAATDPAKALDDFFAAEWDYTMQQRPVWASYLGDRRFNDRWGDYSLAATAASYEHEKDALKRLQAIPRASLGPAEQLNYDLFERDLKERLEGQRYKLYLIPLNQREGP